MKEKDDLLDNIRARQEAQEAEYKKFESECRGKTCHRLLSAGVVDTCKGDSCMRWLWMRGCMDNFMQIPVEKVAQ